MSRTLGAWMRPLGGAAILAVLVWRLGTGPFVSGIRTVNGWALLAAAGIMVVTTVCGAWRWSLVARGLGVGIPLRSAVAACYRAQFLNSVLPGGILGDVHRAVSHGRDAGDVGRGVRAVAWERTAGQAVQVVLVIAVLLALPSPVRRAMPVVAALAVATGAGLVLLARVLPRNGPSRWARILRAAAGDVRHGLLDRRAWPGIVVASIVMVVGHAGTFLIAARTAGTSAPLSTMLPIAMLALLAMAVPVNLAGFGPRESVAAWAFAGAGLGADRGVATGVVYGVMTLAATVPGAVVLAVAWLRRPVRRAEAPPAREPVAAGPGASRG